MSVDHQKLLGLTPRMADDAPLPRVTKKLMLINAAPSAAAASTHDTSKDDAPKDDAPSDDRCGVVKAKGRCFLLLVGRFLVVNRQVLVVR